MRGRYSTIRHHSKDEYGDYHERVIWQTYWKYKLPIMEAEHRKKRRPSLPVGKELDIYMYCAYTILREKFTSNRAEWEKTYDLFIPNNLQL